MTAEHIVTVALECQQCGEQVDVDVPLKVTLDHGRVIVEMDDEAPDCTQPVWDHHLFAHGPRLS